MNLGIDLGTSRVVIYSHGRGIVLDEPAVIAVSRDSGKVVACGEEAEEMLGRTPPSIVAVRPIRKGVIAEYAMAERMLRHFMRRVCSNRIAKPCAAVSIAEQVTKVEQRSFIQAVISAGARRVTLVPETVAAAIGAGMDVSLPYGQMLVNIGAGTTDASVLSLRGTAVSSSVRTAGMDFDESITRYMRARYNLIISESMAELVKMSIGGVLPRENPLTMEVKGSDTLTGLPKMVSVDSEEICEILQEPLADITELILRVLEITPPELSADIMGGGIWLTGGMAQLYGIPGHITRVTGIRCHIADDPSRCVAVGAGKAIQYASSFSEVYDLGDFAYWLSDSVTN